ncbi:MAG: hypothetical protein ACNA8S_17170 [Deferrisomatales bacterium]
MRPDADGALHCGAARGGGRATLSPLGLRLVLGSAAFLCAALQVRSGVAQRTMPDEGMVFLELGEALTSGDVPGAVSTYWSPLYPWVAGVARWLAGGSLYWESAAVQAANLAIFCLALVCFDRLWGELLRHCPSPGEGEGGDDAPLLSPGVWWALGYGLFSWSALELIKVWKVSPSLLTAAGLYWAAALALRLRRSPGSHAGAALLGVALAFLYFSDYLLGFLAPVFLVGALRRGPPGRGRVRRVMAATLVFCALAGAAIAAAHARTGKWAPWEHLRVGYARSVLGIAPFPGEGGGQGLATVLSSPGEPRGAPRVYAFSAAVSGTYPPLSDPSRWIEGRELRFSPSAQLRLLAENLELLVGRLLRDVGAVLAGVLILLFVGSTPSRALRSLMGLWPVWAPAVAGLALVSVVARVEGARAAPHLVLVFGSLLAAAQPGRRPPGRTVPVAVAVVLGYLYLQVAAFAVGGHVLRGFAYEGIHEPALVPSRMPHTRWEVGKSLRKEGVPLGGPVAIVGGQESLYWARLAGVLIRAEIPASEAAGFWALGAEGRREIYSLLREEGFAAVVAVSVPEPVIPEGWRPLAGTGYAALPLPAVAPRNRRTRDETPLSPAP